MEEDWIKSCKLAAQVLEYGKKQVVKGAVIREVLDDIEKHIEKLGVKPSFPAQVSLNETAAHFCPDIDDTSKFLNDVVKLDLGISINGYVSDNALTIDLSGKYEKLSIASKEALDAAILMATPGRKVAEIGKKVDEIISSHGFKPIRNLSGHGVGRFKVHVYPTIPNFESGGNIALEDGMIIAIEPFATTGIGLIEEKGEPMVFMQTASGNVRDNIARNVLTRIKTYEGLPFAKRWLCLEFGKTKTEYALKLLFQARLLKEYPPLVERAKGIVSQHEATVQVAEKPVNLTSI